MKTIQFTGVEHKIENLHLALGISDNDMPQQSETRVYVVDTRASDCFSNDLKDDEFMTLSEEQGRVYTLQGFQEAFNLEEINSDIDLIRFINIII
jgi:hypothetical protein